MLGVFSSWAMHRTLRCPFVSTSRSRGTSSRNTSKMLDVTGGPVVYTAANPFWACGYFWELGPRALSLAPTRSFYRPLTVKSILRRVLCRERLTCTRRMWDLLVFLCLPLVEHEALNE